MHNNEIPVTVAATRRWEATNSLQRRACAFRTLPEAPQAHVAEDGSRLGTPPEETIVYLLWEAYLNTSAVPPVQVF